MTISNKLAIKTTVDTQAEPRQQLLRKILEQPLTPHEVIVELAQLASWTIPTKITMVAIELRRYGARHTHPERLGDEILAKVQTSISYLLVPGSVTEDRVTTFQAAFPGRRLSIGPRVPLASAAESLRMARMALALVEDGVLSKQRILWVEQHLPTMLLHSDTSLLEQLRRRWFAQLDTLTPKQRKRILTTLWAWLETQGSVAETAQHLGVHTQTVRYRLRQLETTFGKHLYSPDARFEMHLVLRADAQRGSLRP